MEKKQESCPDGLRTVAEKVLLLLKKRYPNPHTHLNAADPWQLLVATILAAQCTDARVNMVTPALFARWPTVRDMASADQAEIEHHIRSTGFFRNKAKNILAAARRVRDAFAGNVPNTMPDILSLPGVARKTANVVLFGAYGINEGLAVDTHVGRIAFRLGLSRSRNPLQVERDMMALFPREEWGDVNHRLVWFGRHVCRARAPVCRDCEMVLFCEKKGLQA
jgi:endonuclease-3